jgi:hypothetical protein
MTVKTTKRPALVTILAVIIIVLCSIGLLFSIPGVIMQISGTGNFMMDMFRNLHSVETRPLYDAMTAVVQRYTAFFVSIGLTSILFKGFGLATGVLLLKSYRHALRCVRLYAALCIIQIIVSSAGTFIYIRDLGTVIDKFLLSGMDSTIADTTSSISRFSMIAGAVAGVFISSAEPVILLILSRLRTVREYFEKRK